MLDPRLAGIAGRLADVNRIVAVTGGKGGIGKSVVASTLALALADQGRRTGLLDLDLTGPSDHVWLGAPVGFPEEEFGVEPPLHEGIRFLSIAHFGGATPAPLRGEAVTNALLELLAIAHWGELDTLVIDMPPGLGDTTLDTVRLLPGAEYLVVATPSVVVLEIVRRTLRLLKGLQVPIVGVLENMYRAGPARAAELAAEHQVPFLGELPFDPALEDAVGNPEEIRKTGFFAAMREIATRL